MTATMTSKGQLTLPQSVRRRLRLKPGSVLEVEVEAESVRLTPLKPAEPMDEIEWLRRIGRLTEPLDRDQTPFTP